MPIKNGDTVSVHYTGTFEDGEVFDSSREGLPLEVVLGEESLIPGFEAALIGREKGERFTVVVEPDDAYGEHLEELFMEVSLEEVPSHIKPEAGQMLEISTDEGVIEVQVVEVTPTSVILDANHPLAGETLTFDIEVVDVKAS